MRIEVGKNRFSLKDVCERVGLKPRQVIDWAEKRVVRPDVADTVGSGNPREYSPTNVLEFLVAKELVGLGITVRSVARFLQAVRKARPDLWWECGALLIGRSAEGALVVRAGPRGREDWWEVLGKKLAARRREAAAWVVIDLVAARARIRIA